MSARLHTPVSERDHVRGSLRAPVVLVEYGDFESAHCAAAEPAVGYLRNHMGEGMAFVYRHFPVADVHPFAEIAAEASEAAAAQGKFWEMHDIIFANQDALQADDLVAYAEALGLDPDRFADELSAHVYLPRIRTDFSEGVRSGVTGTPTFFINGVRYDGARDPQVMLDMLDEAAQPHP